MYKNITLATDLEAQIESADVFAERSVTPPGVLGVPKPQGVPNLRVSETRSL